MNKVKESMITSVVLLVVSSSAMAQQTPWGSVLKAAGQAAVQQMCPQAQTTLDQSRKLTAGVSQENFLVTKAKEFLAAGNYQPALDLANYVITALDSKSIDAKKIMEDAKAGLMKMAQDKLAKSQQQIAGQPDTAAAMQTVTGIKSLLAPQK